MDLCSRRIIGWSLESHMRAELVVSALQQALKTRNRSAETIFHSDRGSQYGSNAFRALLDNTGLQQSMSARANPYDNAFTESSIGTLKAEFVDDESFRGESDAHLALFDYIDGYYNTQRSHSSLDYQSPSALERMDLPQKPGVEADRLSNNNRSQICPITPNDTMRNSRSRPWIC